MGALAFSSTEKYNPNWASAAMMKPIRRRNGALCERAAPMAASVAAACRVATSAGRCVALVSWRGLAGGETWIRKVFGELARFWTPAPAGDGPSGSTPDFEGAALSPRPRDGRDGEAPSFSLWPHPPQNLATARFLKPQDGQIGTSGMVDNTDCSTLRARFAQDYRPDRPPAEGARPRPRPAEAPLPK